jgi:hypothetical protein
VHAIEGLLESLCQGEDWAICKVKYSTLGETGRLDRTEQRFRESGKTPKVVYRVASSKNYFGIEISTVQQRARRQEGLP